MQPLNLQQLLGYAQGAGFSGSNANIAAAVAMAESGGNPNAINFADPGGSYGLTQINAAANGPGAVNTLGDPAEAFAQMFNLSNGGSNFSPWSTFNNGSYLPFLNQLTGSGGAAGAGGIVGNLFGSQAPVADALGNTSSSNASPMSQIFTAIENFFQRASFILFGIILVGIGLYFLARPKIEAVGRKIAKAAA